MDAADTESDNVALVFTGSMTSNNAGGEENVAVGNYTINSINIWLC